MREMGLEGARRGRKFKTTIPVVEVGLAAVESERARDLVDRPGDRAEMLPIRWPVGRPAWEARLMGGLDSAAWMGDDQGG